MKVSGCGLPRLSAGGAAVALDLLPDKSLARFGAELARPRGSRSLAKKPSISEPGTHAYAASNFLSVSVDLFAATARDVRLVARIPAEPDAMVIRSRPLHVDHNHVRVLAPGLPREESHFTHRRRMLPHVDWVLTSV